MARVYTAGSLCPAPLWAAWDVPRCHNPLSHPRAQPQPAQAQPLMGPEVPAGIADMVAMVTTCPQANSLCGSEVGLITKPWGESEKAALGPSGGSISGWPWACRRNDACSQQHNTQETTRVRPQAHSGSRREQCWKPSPTGNSPKSKFLKGAPLLALSTPRMHWKPTQQQQGSGGVRDRVTISVSSAEGTL